MSLTILGIDPSLTNTGLCWGNNEESEVWSLEYKIPRKEQITKVGPRVKRIEWYRNQIEDAISNIGPELIVIEGYGYASKKIAITAEYGGVLRWTAGLYSEQTEVIEVAPDQLKKFATGKGKAGKGQIMVKVFKKWGVECENDDEADAYVLYRIGLCYAGICEPENNAQREVLAKLRGE